MNPNEPMTFELARTVSGTKTHYRYVGSGQAQTICGVRAPITVHSDSKATCGSCYVPPEEENR